MIQPLYRLATGTTSVPDGAPSHLRWHNLDNAIRDVQAWIRDSGHFRWIEDGPSIETVWQRPTFECRRTEVVDQPTQRFPPEQRYDTDSDGGIVVAYVCARIYVERRKYREERRRVVGTVDGITVEGFGPVERVYDGDWFAGWREERSWYEGDRAYSTAGIPIVLDTIEWADEP